MLRESQFAIGGGLTIALGAALVIGLVWAGAGFWFFEAYAGGGFGIAFGGFLVYLSREERRRRRAFLSTVEPLEIGSQRRP